MLRGSTGGNATQRIVIQMSDEEKKVIVEKARQLNMTVSELMLQGAAEYAPIDEGLVGLAVAAQASAERSIVAIDDSTRLVTASNARIAAMEAKAKTAREKLRAQMGSAYAAD